LAYLYAGLGVAMLAATMAMFEFGVSLTGQQGQMSPPRSLYTGGTSEQYSDQLWMKLLNDTQFTDVIGRDLASQSLCDQLMCRVCDPDPEDVPMREKCKDRCIGKNAYQEGFDELSEFQDTLVDDLSHPFPSACVLNKGDHRVLVVPNQDEPTSPYGLYSCLTTKSPFCSFEQ